MKDKPWTLVIRGILRDSEGRYLLMQRSSKNWNWAGFWEFPGGKVNRGEDLKTAFVREIKEETGLDVYPGKFVDSFGLEREEDVLLYALFMAESYSGEFVMSDEHDAFGWYSPEEFKTLKVSPPLERVIQRLNRGEL